MIMSGELDRQISRKAIWAFDKDGPDTVAGDAVEHRCKTRSLCDRVSTADRRVVELADHLIPVRICEAFDRSALPAIAVLVGADIGS
ncbi:hypothetical protein SAMN05192541_117164 [Bradyrhizobium arachidis]|nr:hypothetical protein SAMN05192541_117164 [Bradyrhizobium arachidis]